MILCRFGSIFSLLQSLSTGDAQLIVTIDGPAAAGKSSVACRLAERLGFDYLDTGATYRAVTWKAIRDNADFDSPRRLAEVAADAEIRFERTDGELRIFCDGENVTRKIRRPAVTEKVRHVADEPAVREALIELQRDYARGHDIVTEGRDQGTEVFPDADLKFYLDASAEARARRRQADLAGSDVQQNHEEVLASIRRRDRQDRSRKMGGLRCAEDMIVIDSTDLTVRQVVDRMAKRVREKCRATENAARSEAESTA
jgi:cytidylate kinase